MTLYKKTNQSAFSSLIHKLQTRYAKKEMFFDEMISLLIQEGIQFYSRQDLQKFGKLTAPFDLVSVANALTYLDFSHLIQKSSKKIMYVCCYLRIVKFAGRKNSGLNVSDQLFKDSFKQKKRNISKFSAKPNLPIQLKQASQQNHELSLCVKHFRRMMLKLHNLESDWFHVLGGIVGCQFLKEKTVSLIVNRLFRGSCHSSCVQRFMKYLVGKQQSSGIKWRSIQEKIRINWQRTFKIPESPDIQSSQINSCQRAHSTFRITSYSSIQHQEYPQIKTQTPALKRPYFIGHSRKRISNLLPRSEVRSVKNECDLDKLRSIGQRMSEISKKKVNKMKSEQKQLTQQKGDRIAQRYLTEIGSQQF